MRSDTFLLPRVGPQKLIQKILFNGQMAPPKTNFLSKFESARILSKELIV